MTNGNDRNYWNDERLNQLAALAAANTEGIAQHRKQQEATTAYIQTLGEQQETTNTNIDILAGFINGQEQHIATILQEIRDIKADIRGLQLENRRMLEELRSRRDNDG